MVDTATAIEGDLGDAGLDGALANELTDLLRSLLVRGVGALELGLEGRGRDERQAGALAVVDDLGIDVGFLFYRATRYDLHGKALLKTNPKEYIVDTGFRTLMAGYRVTDTGRLFENAVYLQLLYEGWSVHVGKLYGKEVDFVATKDGRVLYVQVTDEMFASETREREIAPLKSIRDNHEKIVVVRQGSYDTDIDGIRIVGARDFFL